MAFVRCPSGAAKNCCFTRWHKRPKSKAQPLNPSHCMHGIHALHIPDLERHVHWAVHASSLQDRAQAAAAAPRRYVRLERRLWRHQQQQYTHRFIKQSYIMCTSEPSGVSYILVGCTGQSWVPSCLSRAGLQLLSGYRPAVALCAWFPVDMAAVRFWGAVIRRSKNPYSRPYASDQLHHEESLFPTVEGARTDTSERCSCAKGSGIRASI